MKNKQSKHFSKSKKNIETEAMSKLLIYELYIILVIGEVPNWLGRCDHIVLDLHLATHTNAHCMYVHTQCICMCNKRLSYHQRYEFNFYLSRRA